jgi:hypothetical protein
VIPWQNKIHCHITMSAQAETAAQQEPISRQVRKKKTFMLHHPESYACLGKYVSTTPRLAALKAASRKHATILLRETNTKIIHQYEGGIKELETPQEVKRGDAVVRYTHKPWVKTRGKPFVMPHLDTTCDDGDVPKNPTA